MSLLTVCFHESHDGGTKGGKNWVIRVTLLTTKQGSWHFWQSILTCCLMQTTNWLNDPSSIEVGESALRESLESRFEERILLPTIWKRSLPYPVASCRSSLSSIGEFPLSGTFSLSTCFLYLVCPSQLPITTTSNPFSLVRVDERWVGLVSEKGRLKTCGGEEKEQRSIPV